MSDSALMIILNRHYGYILVFDVFDVLLHVSVNMCVNCRFLLRISILTCDIDIANLSVCLSVTFRYQMKTA